MTNHDECAHCQNASKKTPGKKTTAGRAEWHLFRRKDNKYAWHLIGDNGSDIIATDGGQGYSNAKDASDMMLKIRSGHYSSAPKQP